MPLQTDRQTTSFIDNSIEAGILLATLANYYQSLQLTLTVSAGVVVGAGLLLAFTLKQDRFEVKKPLNLRSPGSDEST